MASALCPTREDLHAGERPRACTGLSSSIVVTSIVLLTFGAVMIASALATVDRPPLIWPLWQTPAGRQIVFVLAGICLLLITRYAAVPLLGWSWGRRVLPVALAVVVILLLVAAYVPGLADPKRGSSRWVQVGGLVSLQPSEMAKFALVVLMAWLLGRPEEQARRFFGGFVPAIVLLGLFIGLVGLADFGTSALLAAVGVSMTFVAGCRLRHLTLLGLAALTGMVGLLTAQPYRMERIHAFMAGWTETGRHFGYQAKQSLIAVASGGTTGVGLGYGLQKHGYVPESHSDFIFSVICEETGVMGGLLVLALLAALVGLGLWTAANACTRMERLIAFGMSMIFAVQGLLHVAVNLAVVPTTGISLPLVSAGGSGMLVFAVCAGTLAAVARRSELQRTEVVRAAGPVGQE